MRLARAFDADPNDEHEQRIKRLATPVIKYWTCKRAPQHAAEALECLGGAGYVEESDLPRLFRQSPLNGVWEGSGNVICLDVLRALRAEPAALDAYWDEVGRATGADGRLDDGVAALRKELDDLDAIEARARRLVERMAIGLPGRVARAHMHRRPSPTRSARRVVAGDAGRAFGNFRQVSTPIASWTAPARFASSRSRLVVVDACCCACRCARMLRHEKFVATYGLRCRSFLAAFPTFGTGELVTTRLHA